MSDESFHLTAIDVRRYDFGKAKLSARGYDPERVEQFRGEVADELERLGRLNSELESKVRSLGEQLKAFRERDRALNEALVSAQQLRAEMRDQAEREGQLMMREAQAEAERLVESARGEISRLETEVTTLARLRRTYLAQLRQLVERQLAEVQAAEDAAHTPPEGSPAATAHGHGHSRTTSPTPAWLNSILKE